MSREPEKQSHLLNWLDQRLVGPAITILLGAIITGKIVIQITGVQFNIGLTFLVILIIFAVMGISFFLGMVYLIYSFAGFFTKQKPPLISRILAKIMMIVMFPLYWREKKNRQPLSESAQHLLAKIREKESSNVEHHPL